MKQLYHFVLITPIVFSIAAIGMETDDLRKSSSLTSSAVIAYLEKNKAVIGVVELENTILNFPMKIYQATLDDTHALVVERFDRNGDVMITLESRHTNKKIYSIPLTSKFALNDREPLFTYLKKQTNK